LIGDFLTVDAITTIGNSRAQTFNFRHIDDIGAIAAFGQIEQMACSGANLHGALAISASAAVHGLARNNDLGRLSTSDAVSPSALRRANLISGDFDIHDTVLPIPS
jgi:hypothetical protein